MEKTEENNHFREFLQAQNTEMLDQQVSELNDLIEPMIDCTACGNCCRSLMIVVTDEEADNLSAHLQVSRGDFDGQYLEKGSNGLMILNRMPCHFLSGNRCTVYENRFAGCREFPALHVPGFGKRLFTIFMHYNRCPIIFNVVEKLKEQLSFTHETGNHTNPNFIA